MWMKQREILLSTRDNYMTAVSSCLESGKDWISARAALWFYCTRWPCKVICTSTSLGQMKQAIWGEFGRAIREARQPLGIDQKHLLIRRLKPDGRPYEDDWIKFLAVRQVENLMGTHLPGDEDHPTILVVIDESSGVASEQCRAIEGIAHRIVSIGNPLKLSGYYADIIRGKSQEDEFRPGKYRRLIIRIDARQSPNVARGIAWDKGGRVGPCPPPVIAGLMTYPSYCHRLKENPEYWVSACLHGQLPENLAEQVIVPRGWLQYGRDAWHMIDREHRATLPKYMGVDSFEGGGDMACWTVVDQLGVCGMRTLSGSGIPRDSDGLPRTSRLLEITCEMQDTWDVPWENIAVDKAGSGLSAIVAPLRKMGRRAQAIQFGQAVPKRLKSEYVNFRACLYGELRKQVDPGLELEDPSDPKSPEVARKWLSVETGDGKRRWHRAFTLPPNAALRAEVDALIDELSLIPRMTDGEGKMFLPPKGRKAGQTSGLCLREILGHSPDRSDALCLAVWRMRTRARAERRVRALESADPNYDVTKTKAWKRIMGG